jgi:metal-sulfur cluster biosynthetic enzyme
MDDGGLQLVDTAENARTYKGARFMSDETVQSLHPATEYPEGSVEAQIKESLRAVKDPEIGLDVVQLGLIRDITLQDEGGEIKMMLTTPFCPYGGWLIQQVKDTASSNSGKLMKVSVLPDLWDPNFMEDPGLLMGW